MLVLLGAGVGSQVLSSGSLDISGLHWDHGSVGVSHQASVVGPVGGVGSNGVDGSSGSGVGNLGGVNLSGVDWHNGTVGVGHQLGRAHSDGGGENQKLHDESWVCFALE